jgi:hypothetical protein
MARVVIEQLPPTMCRFAESAFNQVIGTDVPLTFDNKPSTTAHVVDAEVIEGGYAVRLTLDVPDDALGSHVDLPSYTLEGDHEA